MVGRCVDSENVAVSEMIACIEIRLLPQRADEFASLQKMFVCVGRLEG